MSTSLAYHLPSASDSGQGLSLTLTGLIHIAVLVVILGPWVTPTPLSPASENTVRVQTFSLPEPVIKQPVLPRTKPSTSEPVVSAPEPEPHEVKPEPVNNELAFERVQKPEPTPPKKPEIKQKSKPIEKPKPESKLSKPSSRSQDPTKTANNDKPTKTLQTSQPIDSSDETENVATTSSQVDAAPFDVSQFKPVEKLAPDYPRSALRKGLEGDCTVTYRVSQLGRVESPEVSDDCHPAFIRPSLEAAQSFRYTPRKVNGKAVAVTNVSNTFQYRIQ
ncbi:Ferric siderophore transport system, periplasmic binding protein TonB [Methylophaga frappieri]|uniref:Protein TonB n=1 Tax=Methylophaga frappieri (strain ATCC BAA-2434 / DSM 25690 / JAM7) TaxID=754477 RepID=I1YF53_METFJ|nr:energy transducer TonB [Methylophaga frappieri]AFJ01546.1 Ferric siderophore transport system, periplasmic binding protein TonB [Methylophaga frappieri]